MPQLFETISSLSKIPCLRVSGSTVHVKLGLGDLASPRNEVQSLVLMYIEMFRRDKDLCLSSDSLRNLGSKKNRLKSN